MKTRVGLLTLFFVLVASSAGADPGVSDLLENERGIHRLRIEEPETSPERTTILYLRKATGNLEINASSSTDTYEAYFHIPISYLVQVPILIEVESPDLIDFRYVHLKPPNMIVAARMNQAPTTQLDWTAWMLSLESSYSDLPDTVPIPTPEQLPDSVRKWLEPTDCAQIEAPIVQEIADSIRGGTTNLIELADDICDYCYLIPWQFPHEPIAFDAVYALNWGSSCTGHAHAGVALFRANDVPSRTLLNMPVGIPPFDMHWVLEYYVPDYGWVRMEPSGGLNPGYPEYEMVTLLCQPEDEFPLFHASGIEGYWHSSDPELGMYSPDWGGAHRCVNIQMINESTEQAELAHSLTDSVFSLYCDTWGIGLNPWQQTTLQSAFDYQSSALTSLQDRDVEGYIANMQLALDHYRTIDPEPISTLFFDDFEGGAVGWEHGGTFDEWELGTPTYGPPDVHSGDICWGTDLDDTYENNADTWLKSPPIDLAGLSCAYLNFWVWNWVQDQNQGYVHDPLWMDITIDGEAYIPLCSHMGGINDDPEIPDVGGWSSMTLDLTRYVGNTVQFRFRFESDVDNAQPGSYIDDVHVYGRVLTPASVGNGGIQSLPMVFELTQNYPNPFNPSTTIDYVVPAGTPRPVQLDIYDLRGHHVRNLVDEEKDPGRYSVHWDGRDREGQETGSGIYLYRIVVGELTSTKKMVVLR
jgi:transglutaminase-like putative cysteine protease